MTTQHDQKILAPVRPITGTVGEDVMTVHRLDADGNPLCGVQGEVFQWQRSVTCAACLRPA